MTSYKNTRTTRHARQDLDPMKTQKDSFHHNDAKPQFGSVFWTATSSLAPFGSENGYGSWNYSQPWTSEEYPQEIELGPCIVDNIHLP
jgi:hypothetical protein